MRAGRLGAVQRPHSTTPGFLSALLDLLGPIRWEPWALPLGIAGDQKLTAGAVVTMMRLNCPVSFGSKSMDGFANFSLSALIALVVFASGSLARRSASRNVNVAGYAIIVFCIATLGSLLHAWAIGLIPSIGSVGSAIGIGAMSVAFFFFFRYLAVRESLGDVVDSHKKGGTS